MKKWITVAAVSVVLSYLAATSLVAVEESELVIVSQLGEPVRVIDRPGLALKWPDPLQTVIRLDGRLQATDSGVREFLTRDRRNLTLSSFVTWRISDPRRFMQSVRDLRAAEHRLADLVNSELGVALGHRPLSDLLTTEGGSRLPALFAEVTDSSRATASAEFGIEVVDVKLRRFGFPRQNLPAVYERMRAERDRMSNKLRAEGEEGAASIRAETDRAVRELLADTYRETQIIRSRGEAEAMAIYAEAFKQDARFYKLVRSLEAYQRFLDDKTTVILSADSPLFEHLQSPPKVR